MITKEDEARLENWARANRECFKVTRGATAVFCDNLKYWYGLPEDFQGRSSVPVHRVDIQDANKIDEAFKSTDLPLIYKQVLRMFFVSRVAPAIIERRLNFGYKTFWKHKERAIETIIKIANDIEKRGIITDENL